jgi:hypothetical protein
VSLLVITASDWKKWEVTKTTDTVYTWIPMDTPTGTLVNAVMPVMSCILRDTIWVGIDEMAIPMRIMGREIRKKMATTEEQQHIMTETKH